MPIELDPAQRLMRHTSHKLFVGLLLTAVWLTLTATATAQRPLPAGKRQSGKDGSNANSGSQKEFDPSRPIRTRKMRATKGSGPTDYTSRHFLVHTDLPAKEAQELLKRLETMLGLISKYWGRAPVGIIECYVVKDLNNWSVEVLEPGLDSIRGRAGVTHTQVTSMGANFRAKATVYAIADRGTPLHEAVHAYCGQAFGRVGPTWYAEGMAEMGHYWKENDYSVNASEYVIDYLRREEPKPLLEIVATDQVTGDSWQNYAWRWALCHVLANNPNYAPRFRPLGLGLLMHQDVSFQETYGSMAREIEFEYKLFLKDLKKGYRVDLCGWDWKAKSRRDRTGAPFVAKVDAGRGWQPSRLKVVSGEEYEYSVTGTWGTGREFANSNLTADGNADGVGRLTGILFNDYALSEPIPLGEFGTFKAPSDGDLFLRCQDDWASLGDNKGKVVVKLKVKGKGKPLTSPRAEPPKPGNFDKESESSTDEDAPAKSPASGTSKPKSAPPKPGIKDE